MSTPSTKSSAAAAARGAKLKQTKLISLKLSQTQLTKFPHEKPAAKPEPPKPSSSSSSSSPAPVAPNKESSPASELKTEIKTEMPNGTSSSLQVPVDGRKKGGPKAGTKRGLSAVVDGQPKPRGKPGPKKRKLDGDPNGDESGRPWTTPAPTAGHKLGPKANQGAINAGLRALDRTGKPCRKWEKKGFALKSFTGVGWTLPSWGTQKRQSEVKGELGQSDTPTSNSENQPPHSSSNVGSETSRNVADIPDVADSPAVITASA